MLRLDAFIEMRLRNIIQKDAAAEIFDRVSKELDKRFESASFSFKDLEDEGLDNYDFSLLF